MGYRTTYTKKAYKAEKPYKPKDVTQVKQTDDTSSTTTYGSITSYLSSWYDAANLAYDTKVAVWGK